MEEYIDNEAVSSSNNANIQPFKATKIWNEILQAFYLGMDVNKHRRNMKTYYDCFSASEAVSWLKNYLIQCDNFQNKKVTRFQALNLLRKYHKSNIIERIKIDKNDRELQDNNELFRFSTGANENLPFLHTSKSDVDLLESCSIETNKEIVLNLNEKTIIYKKVVWEKIILLQPSIKDYIKVEKIDGTSLYNNMTRVNVNGIVQLVDKTQDLPLWIMSAMKCLATWPKASGSGSCLPKYPGFEYDIFNLIRDYFTNIEEPLIPFEFYPVLMNAFESYIQEKSLNRRDLFGINSASSLKEDSYNNLNLPSNCVYETAFSDKEPVTKIVPINELSGVFVDYFKTNIQISNPIIQNSNFKNSPLNALATMPRKKSKLRSPINASTPQNVHNGMFSDILCLDSPPEAGEYMLSKEMSSKRFHSLQRTNHRRLNLSGTGSVHLPKQFQLIQLLLLILPSANRRQLQLLIRLFHKIIQNKELCLLTKDSLALKEHIVNIFARCILRCRKEIDYNELKTKEFVSFLIDECMNIFEVPDELSKEIHQTLNNLRLKKSTTNYCQKITPQEFEMQRDVLSEAALSELMESIMRDESISERDKLKWIKQFKLYHPEVYDIYFTSCAAKTGNEKPITGTTETAARRTRSLGSTLLPNVKFAKRFLSLKF